MFMKRTSEIQRHPCISVRDLLIKAQYQALPSSDKKLVSGHLKNCTDCRNFQATLIRMTESFDISRRKDLQLDPHIRYHLLERMETRFPRSLSSVSRFREKLKMIFEYRIPVYQALIVFILVLAAVTLFQPSPPPADVYQLPQVTALYPDSAAFENQNVFIHRGLDAGDKLGRTLKEDSVLTRYITYSL